MIWVGFAVGGCALDRAGIGREDGGQDAIDASLDAGLDGEDAGRRDGGPPCVPGGCDDRNPCTNDICLASEGCVHRPVPGACDDGVLCNGSDSCGEGTCSVHDGVDPCPGASSCDVALDACTGCESDADCPAENTGVWSLCTFPTECATTGSRQRTIRRFACSATGVCEPSERVETEPCARTTEGVACGVSMAGSWSACVYDHETCSTAGTRTRTVSGGACAAGVCEPRTVMETDATACARETAGATCVSSAGPWSGCAGFDNLCDESGTETRGVMQGTCSGGTCTGGLPAVETRTCGRETDGTSCGGIETCSTWGTCLPLTGICNATVGVQTRRCTGAAACTNESCASTSRVETRSCNLPAGGTRCISERICGSCEGLTAGGCVSGIQGVRRCEAVIGHCNPGAMCTATDMRVQTEEPCMCP